MTGEQMIPKRAADNTVNALLERVMGLEQEIIDLMAERNALRTAVEQLQAHRLEEE